MAETPAPSPSDLPMGTLVVTRHNPRQPVHVTDVTPFPGAMGGYLVTHDGPGIPSLSIADVRLWTPRKK
jgi:hypothetical protein